MLHGTDRTRRKVRQELLGAVFQDPLTSLNPTMRIGRQLTERGIAEGPRAAPAIEAGVPDPSAGCASTRTSCPAACASG